LRNGTKHGAAARSRFSAKLSGALAGRGERSIAASVDAPLHRFDRLLRQLDALLTAEQLQQHKHARFATRAAIRTPAFGITDLYSVPRTAKSNMQDADLIRRQPTNASLVSVSAVNIAARKIRQS
jgi:hypothetical protein